MNEHTGSVLLVDDQPANLEVLSRLLGDRGYHTRAVTSGERAIEAGVSHEDQRPILSVSMMSVLAVCITSTLFW